MLARVASGIPLRIDEILFYHYGLNPTQQNPQQYIDLQPGMTLRAEWGGYQYCDAPGGPGNALNGYVGYGCGFNSGGNVTFTLVAVGAPGIHTIDVYPSVWWGPSNFASQQVVEYRYPLLTPQDHPELMPSFHFTFLVTP